MKKLNILIVDDIFTNRLLLSELIKTLGHNSEQAENGKEAIDFLEKNNFDLVLMDIEMPVMNGLETCEHIRQKFPAPKKLVPIVALTAHNPSLFFDDFSDAGFDELLTKPYSLDKIIELINTIS
ncbi:MAG TPA: response regulator [Bacteroidales bacterium]|nr:response regulator [Bacteroidales bacterium]